MSWDGTLSTAVVGALMQCAKMMPAVAKFVFTAFVGTLMHCAKMMPAEESLSECIRVRQLLREGSVSSDALRQGSCHYLYFALLPYDAM